MEGGFIITSRQADAYSRNQPMTMKLRWENNPTMREKVFFSLYRNEGVTYVIAENGEDLSDFVDAGVLKDLRSRGVPTNSTGSDFYALVKSLQFNSEERIRRCNDLRDQLYGKVQLKVRACGPELESLLKRNVYARCHEMVGMFDKGTYLSTDCTLYDKKYTKIIDENLHDFNNCESDFWDLGQRKLNSVFDGFVMARDIIYIGSSPGDSWLALMNKYPNIVVHSFDPRPLSSYHPNVKHYKIEMKIVSDVVNLLDLSKKYDLIWDVRGDYVDDESYEKMVKFEIKLLNDLLCYFGNSLVRINIKIRLNSLNQYFLYGGGRFFLMPYTLERDKKELRYVARTGVQNRFSEQLCCRLRSWMDMVSFEYNEMRSLHSEEDLAQIMKSTSYTYSNYNLFLNSKLMRLDVMDYITVMRCDSDIDINLFSINCNSPLRMVEYFEKSYPVVCSYFSNNYLNSTEFPLVDYECLDFVKYSVYDSRIIINKLIPGLHLIIPKCIGLMANELTTSESFRLQQSYDSILNRCSNSAYVNAKSLAAIEEGSSYCKFPRPFSIMDEMISVSGHMMRFAYLCLVKKNISFLTYCDKILYNFFMNRCVDSAKSDCLFRGKFAWYDLKTKKCAIEKKSNQFWHSIPEWRSGLLALKHILSERYHSSIDRMVTQFNVLFAYFVTTNKVGYEVYEFQRLCSVARLQKNFVYRARPINNLKEAFALINELSVEISSHQFGLNFLTVPSARVLNADHILVKFFKVDISVRYLHTIFVYVSTVSGISHSDIKIMCSDMFHWKRLVHLSNLLFYKHSDILNLWTEDDLREIYSCEFFPLFSFEWKKVSFEWRNDYYYFFRMLIYLRRFIFEAHNEPISSHWRSTYNRDWLTSACDLGLRQDLINSLILSENEMTDSLFSLTYDSEILYRKVMEGLINSTP